MRPHHERSSRAGHCHTRASRAESTLRAASEQPPSWLWQHTSQHSRPRVRGCCSLCLRPAACEEREIGPSPCRQTLLLPRTRPLRTDRRRINHAAGAAGVRKDEVDNEESARFVVERARHSNRRNQHINDCIGDQHRSKRLCQGVWREQCCGSPRRTDRTLNTDCDNVGLWTLRV